MGCSHCKPVQRFGSHSPVTCHCAAPTGWRFMSLHLPGAGAWQKPPDSDIGFYRYQQRQEPSGDDGFCPIIRFMAIYAVNGHCKIYIPQQAKPCKVEAGPALSSTGTGPELTNNCNTKQTDPVIHSHQNLGFPSSEARDFRQFDPIQASIESSRPRSKTQSDQCQ